MNSLFPYRIYKLLRRKKNRSIILTFLVISSLFLSYQVAMINIRHPLTTSYKNDIIPVLRFHTSSDSYEPDDSASQANRIAIGTSQTHSIDPVGDVDWVYFELSYSAYVTIETSGTTGDTVIRLYDESLSFITSDDDSGQGSFSKIERNLDAGKYYVKIEEYGNNDIIDQYTIRVTASSSGDSYEPDDSASQANQIAIGSSQTHSIDPVGDVDWVYFELSYSTDVVIETSGTSGDTVITLYDNALSSITSDDDSGQGSFSKIERHLSAGRYYVKIEEYGNDGIINEYTISVTASSTSSGDSYEPDDSASQASYIAIGTSQTHSINPVGDVDWVYFDLPSPAYIIIETSGITGDTEIFLYDNNLFLITSNDEGGQGHFSKIERNLDAGRYYVKIEEYGNDGIIDEYYISITVRETTIYASTADWLIIPLSVALVFVVLFDLIIFSGYLSILTPKRKSK